MSLSANKSRLAALSKEVTVRWHETREHWRDTKSEEFERRFMRELTPRVGQAAAALEKLEELFARIRKDCE